MNELFLILLAFPFLLFLLVSFLELMRSRALIKLFKKREEIHEKEWKQVIHCYGNIYDKLDDLEIRLAALQDDVFDVIIKNTGEKKTGARGPYGPRKKKVLEYKKVPPEN